MFEGALVESRGQLGSRAVRWTAAGSLVAQCLAAGFLVVVPMLRPDTLQMLGKAPQLVSPAVPKPMHLVQTRNPRAATTSAASVPSLPITTVPRGGSLIRNLMPGPLGQNEPAPLAPGTQLAMGGGGPDLLLPGPGSRMGTAIMRAVPAGPVKVSSGVSAGLLLVPIQPTYPAIAKAAGVQGTVIIEAVISKAGRIESAHAVSGPEMLRRAALDAVAGAKYRPYELNGQAVEVQTSFTVNFRLGS